MNYSKTILCFADSRKLTGRCIAGKELNHRQLGGWVRPVSARPAEEISITDRRYQDGTMPAVMDLIEIPMSAPKPNGFQHENHLIDDQYYWVKQGRGTWQDALKAVDRTAGPLWLDGDHSYNGMNDRITIASAANLTSSLMLVKPTDLVLAVAMEGPDGKRKRKVRAKFHLGSTHYWLSVTDVAVEDVYLKGEDGEFPVDEAILCVSLSEPFNGYTFKLAAAVITPENIGT
jgi:hypothetical protein